MSIIWKTESLKRFASGLLNPSKEKMSTQADTKPKNSRMTHLDAVRGLAVMGILVMNSVSFGLGNEAYFDVSAKGTYTTLDWVLGVLGELFADQKFMGLFSLLFGASILLFLERAQAKDHAPVKLSLWRNALLLVMGICHALVWTGDVLTVYAVCAPLLLLMRNRSSRFLIIGGVAVFLLALVQEALFSFMATDEMLRLVWREELNSPEVELLAVSYITDAFVRALGMMMVGMGLYRSGALTRPNITPRLLRGCVLTIGLGAAVSAGGFAWVASQGFDGVAVRLGNLPNGLVTIPMTLSYLVLFIVWDQRSTGQLVRRVRCLGQMALTNYIGQTLIGLSLAAMVPAEWVSRSTIWLMVLTVWVVQLYGSAAWLEKCRFGPLEWLWRCATYRRWEKLRRSFE